MFAFKLKYRGNRFLHAISVREFLQTVARYLLLTALFYGPWAYGSTRPTLVDFFDDGLLLCFGLHLLGLVLEARLPRYPLVPTVCLALLILQGLWMCFNARSILDDTFWEFVPLGRPFPHLPGTWDKSASLFTLKTLCAMSAAFLVASDLMADTVWKWRLWRTIAIAGCSVIFYGLIQKGLGPNSIISMYPDPRINPTFFGPYRYHGNAGSYLNMIWPVFLSLLMLTWRKRQAYVEQALWSFCLVMGLAACFVNTSKGASVITVLMMVAAGFSFSVFFQGYFIRSRRVSRVLTAIFALGFVAILIYGGITSQLQGRWDDLMNSKETGTAEGRFITDGVCYRMIPEAGWFGFGPGTFSAVFPLNDPRHQHQYPYFWVYAHEDYLQTLVEYGYVGTSLWSMFFFGGIAKTIIRGLHSSLRSNDWIVYRASSLSLGGLALHSLIDFPLQVASIQLYAAMFFAYAWSSAEDMSKPQGSEGVANVG